jgi:beta-mannan synthase
MGEVSQKIMIPESFQFQVSSYDISGQLKLIWELIKAPLIVPLLTLGVYISLAMSLMLLMERVYMGIVSSSLSSFGRNQRSDTNGSPCKMI